jgi:hypothetical protein
MAAEAHTFYIKRSLQQMDKIKAGLCADLAFAKYICL